MVSSYHEVSLRSLLKANRLLGREANESISDQHSRGEIGRESHLQKSSKVCEMRTAKDGMQRRRHGRKTRNLIGSRFNGGSR